MTRRPWINHPDYYRRIREWMEWGWFASHGEKGRMRDPGKYRLHIVDDAVREWSEREPRVWCHG